MCTLGTEEVVLTVVDPRHAAPSPVPRVVERLQLFFRMPGGDTGSLDGAVGATGAPLCVAFHARVTTSAGFQTALGVMARSLDDALARYVVFKRLEIHYESATIVATMLLQLSRSLQLRVPRFCWASSIPLVPRIGNASIVVAFTAASDCHFTVLASFI